MKKTIFLFLYLSFFISHGQKSAPVAGHAARLIDLIKKDYSSEEYLNRNETILKDMDEVFLLFNTYNSTNNIIFEKLTDPNVNNKIYKLREIKDEDRKDDIETTIASYTTTTQENIQKIKELNNNLNSNGNYKEKSQELILKEQELSKNKKILENLKYNYTLNRIYSLYKHFNKDSIVAVNNDKNLYLSSIIALFIEKFDNNFNYKGDALAQSNYTSSIQKALPFIGGDLDFSNLIDGLSRFLAQRIKDELTTNAINKIKDYLKDSRPDSYLNEFMVLLPTTSSYLKSFNSNQILNFVDDLKQYIEDDLNHLLANASNLKNTPRFKEYITQNPDLEFAFEAMEIIPQVSKLDNPIDYFDILEGSRNVQRWATLVPAAQGNESIKYNIGNSIKLASLIAHSLIVVDNGIAKFASASFMADYASDVNFYLLYLGFLRQQNIKYYNINFYTNQKNNIDKNLSYFINTSYAPDAVNKEKEKMRFITDNISRISSNAEKLHDDFENIKRTNSAGEKVTAEQIYSLLTQLINFSEELFATVDDLVSNKELNPKSSLNADNIVNLTQPYIKTSRRVNEIFLDLQQKNFTSALIKTIEIPFGFSDLVQIDSVFKNENTVKLIYFINDIAVSKDAEDVKNALNTFALPTGSSSIKENIESYYSINSYPGLYAGFTGESISGGETYSIGFTAPIGIYAQPWKSDGKHITWGLFLPIIDIAAPVRLRLDNSKESETLPDLQFKDIFSPGLYLSLGYNKSPLALNLGGQFGPSLKGYNESNNEAGNITNVLIEKQAFFWSATLTIDIPLFNIYAK